MHLEMSVSKILAHSHLWCFKTTKIFIEMTSNMIYIVAFGGGLKCPRKIPLNTQWGLAFDGLFWPSLAFVALDKFSKQKLAFVGRK